jgi:hypothetical protein
MATPTSGGRGSPATKVVLRAVVYYAILIAAGAVLWRALPQTALAGQYTLDAFLGTAPAAAPAAEPSRATLVITSIVAMLAAILLSIPVAWMYQLTRAKRGYQQSVVQLLIVLPIVVAGIVVLVKFSLALAFSLAGIVAAVRFRNTLEDSKDAVYVFLAIGVGLAAAVDVPVAAAISIVFNAAVVLLWYTDFGHSPVELEGRIAERRLARARDLARTGTFVARIDDEVMRNMTREQLEGLAQRAWRRAHARPGDGTSQFAAQMRLDLRTRDSARTREVAEPHLAEHTKEWRLEETRGGEDGVHTLRYLVQLRRKTRPDELVALLRAACAPELSDVELR